jgi:hypothetical protein
VWTFFVDHGSGQQLSNRCTSLRRVSPGACSACERICGACVQRSHRSHKPGPQAELGCATSSLKSGAKIRPAPKVRVTRAGNALRHGNPSEARTLRAFGDSVNSTADCAGVCSRARCARAGAMMACVRCSLALCRSNLPSDPAVIFPASIRARRSCQHTSEHAGSPDHSTCFQLATHPHASVSPPPVLSPAGRRAEGACAYCCSRGATQPRSK